MPSVQPIYADCSAGSATWPGGPRGGQASDPETNPTLLALSSRDGMAGPSLSSRKRPLSPLPSRASHCLAWLPSHVWHGKVRKRIPTCTHIRVSTLPFDMSGQCPPPAHAFLPGPELLIKLEPGFVSVAKVKTAGYHIALSDEGIEGGWVLGVSQAANVVSAEPGVGQGEVVTAERGSDDVAGDERDEHGKREDKVRGGYNKDEDGDEQMTGM